jgi:transcriptional regulator with XRE-family HTH domain
VFRLVNRRTGTSQSKIGAAVGLDQGYVSKVMSGQRAVASIDVLERIACGLGMPDGARAVLGLAPARSASVDIAANRSGSGDCGPALRVRTWGSAGEQLELLRQGVTDRVAGAALGACSVEEWELTAVEHARATRFRSAASQLSDLANDITELQRMLKLRHSASTLRRMTRVAAQMAGLMSLRLIKLDKRAASLAWARTAQIAAHEVEDPATRASPPGFRSLSSVGDLREALMQPAGKEG